MSAPRPLPLTPDGVPRSCATRHAMECQACGSEFDPVATRWRCTRCGFKAACCEGEPL